MPCVCLADEIYRKEAVLSLSAAGLRVGERVCVCVCVCVCVNEKKGWGISSARLAPFPSTNCWQSTHRGCATVFSSTRTPCPRGAQLRSLLYEGRFRAH